MKLVGEKPHSSAGARWHLVKPQRFLPSVEISLWGQAAFLGSGLRRSPLTPVQIIWGQDALEV